MMIHIQHNGQQLGPFTIEQVRQYLAMGQLSPQDLAVHQGGTQWLPLAQLMANLGDAQSLFPGPTGIPQAPHQPMLPSAPIPAQPYAQPQQPVQPVLYNAPQQAYAQHPQVAPQKTISGTVKTGYICMGVSLLFLPPFVGLAALILGIINCTKGQPNTTHGIIQIVGSIICALIGMALGAAVLS